MAYDRNPAHVAALGAEGAEGISEHAGVAAYDASYLWLALRLEAELVAFDKELERAATVR